MKICKLEKVRLECAAGFNQKMKCKDVFLFYQEFLLKCSERVTNSEHV